VLNLTVPSPLYLSLPLSTNECGNKRDRENQNSVCALCSTLETAPTVHCPQKKVEARWNGADGWTDRRYAKETGTSGGVIYLPR